MTKLETMLQKIVDFFKPRSLSKQETVNSAGQKPTIPQTGFELKESLIADILNALMPLRFDKRSVQSLTLHITDYPNLLVIEALLVSPDFEKDLRFALSNASINLGDNWLWKFSLNTQPGQTATNLNNGLWLDMEQDTGGVSNVKARVTAIRGSLKEPIFTLNSGKATYNIGRGPGSRLDNGIYHENHIIIDDAEVAAGDDDTDTRLNRYVSRAHASIVYKQAGGFVLKVYPGGCFVTGNRTRIFRPEEQPIDVMNTLLDYPLKNGDQIELGKSVVLQFEII